MAARNTKRSFRINSTLDELPSAFTACKSSDAQLQLALDRYAESGSVAHRDALTELFLPMVTALAIRRKMRERPHNDLDDLISDGCIAVMSVIDRNADLPLGRLCGYIFGAVKLQFNRGFTERMWAPGKKQNARDNRTMLDIRSMFLRQHGRMPTGAEIRAALAKMIDNGQIEKEFTRKVMTPASVIADQDGVDLLAQLGAEGYVGPLYETMNRETMKIALKGLKGLDRKLFKFAIEGMNPDEIAERVGLSRTTVDKRVNGLLWAARCRADLAAHLGTEPAKGPIRNAYGFHVSMRQVPPAKLAMVG